MARPGYRNGAISQRERVSLVAELLLEGALRVMDSDSPKVDVTESRRACPQTPAVVSKNNESIRMQENVT